MTRTSQLEFVTAELAEVQRIQSAGGIAAIGMNRRRAELEAEQRSLTTTIARLAAGELTFAGDPVVGSQALLADFAAPALQAFEKAVIALAAARERPLASRARLPGRAQNQLFVTAIAHGSFGFVLEELDEDAGQQGTLDFEIDEPSPLAAAMRDAQAILESSRAADDGRILRGKVDPAIEAAVVRGLVDQEVDATVHRVIVGHQAMRGRLLGLAARPRRDGSAAG